MAKTVGLFFINVVLISFFFTYSGVLGYHIMWVDIASAVLWAALAHYISYRLYVSQLPLEKYVVPALVTFTLMLAAFFV
ncbi:MAG: hypothetical protein Q8S19_07435, partial [Bacillota bacterium]|nr:hypothetical protein [Bacillota bacterium]